MTMFIPIAVAIVGILMFFGGANSKVSESGKIMFFCGLLAWLLSTASQKVLHF